jgi:hypothetical protein
MNAADNAGCSSDADLTEPAGQNALARLVDAGTNPDIDPPLVEFAMECFAEAMLKSNVPVAQIMFHRMTFDPRYAATTVSWASATSGTMFEGRRAELVPEGTEATSELFPTIYGYDTHRKLEKPTFERLRIGFSCAARCDAILELISVPPCLFDNADLMYVDGLLKNFDDLFEDVLAERIS